MQASGPGNITATKVQQFSRGWQPAPSSREREAPWGRFACAGSLCSSRDTIRLWDAHFVTCRRNYFSPCSGCRRVLDLPARLGHAVQFRPPNRRPAAAVQPWNHRRDRARLSQHWTRAQAIAYIVGPAKFALTRSACSKFSNCASRLRFEGVPRRDPRWRSDAADRARDTRRRVDQGSERWSVTWQR